MMSQAKTLRTSLVLLVVLGGSLFILSENAEARPGSGQTFKSSSSSSSSGISYSSSSSTTSSSSGSTYSDFSYSSGDSDSYSLLSIALIFLGGNFLNLVYQRVMQEKRQEWSTSQSSQAWDASPGELEKDPSISESFQKILTMDPGFSRVLLEDFLYALFVEIHQSRGGEHFERMSAYLAPSAIQTLRAYPADEVRDIIVGSLSFDDVHVPNTQHGIIQIAVRFLSNYTEVTRSGEQSWYSEEVWTLTRNAAYPSRKPEQARNIGCPNCGAPLDGVFQGVCKYCNTAVSGEQELDWRVQNISIENREARGPMLTGTVEEEGTESPTIFDPLLNQNQTRLQARDPSMSWQALYERIGMIFATFHEAWSAQNLLRMRPFMSDNLFQIQTYWIETYKKQGLRNVSESPQLLKMDLCKVDTDGHYDSVTVRIFAQNIDYTIDTQGNIVGGDRSKTRDYTEYWTLIRGKEVLGIPHSDRACPNCGASLDSINMAGDCSSCGIKVTAGTFDWVLSRIEQDEVYRG